MDNISVVEVFSNEKKVGRIAMTPEQVCAFEYDPEYISGISISPYHLPLKQGLTIAKRDPFDGNFGVFDDSLPDGWGNLILDRYLRSKGIDPQRLNILQRLSLVGSTGRGALEYRPDRGMASKNEFIDFDILAAETQKILTSDYSGESLDTLYRQGGSPGGARPKVFVKIDNKEWLVKFKATQDPDDIGEIEYKYSLLAKQCGIIMPETRLFEGKYFGVERFDRDGDQKIHTVSAAGLLNANYRIPCLDYSYLFKLTLNLTKDIEQVYQLFRIMAFNVIIKNRDDHAKNFSFQLKGRDWVLSPAYDLLPSSGFNGQHTTSVNGEGLPSKSDMISVATEVGLNKQRVTEIIDEIFRFVR